MSDPAVRFVWTPENPIVITVDENGPVVSDADIEELYGS